MPVGNARSLKKKIPKCPRCHRTDSVTTEDYWGNGHYFYVCYKPGGCGTTWEEKHGYVLKKTVMPPIKKTQRGKSK